MPMPRDAIERVIRERMLDKWPKRLLGSNASPVCTIGVVQDEGPNFGTPVLCTCEDMDNLMLADLLQGIANYLRAHP